MIRIGMEGGYTKTTSQGPSDKKVADGVLPNNRLQSDEPKGKFPLFDLYKQYGRVVFQLYAGCVGCDFTEKQVGIPGIGLKRFLDLIKNTTPPLSSATLGEAIWEHHPEFAQAATYQNSGEVTLHLQQIIDIYTLGKLYDGNSNFIDIVPPRASM